MSMTREQVKQELRELKSIITLTHSQIQVNDTKGLQEKYEKAIAKLSYEEQVVFVEHIYNQEPYWKIGLQLGYSEEWVRKTYSKIIDKLANMLEIKQTNFDKITKSVESLAWFIDVVTSCCANELCETCPINKQKGVGCYKHTIKEWLQQEIKDEDI